MNTLGTTRPYNISRARRKEKMSIKQRIGHWLLRSNDEYADQVVSVDESTPSFDSQGFRIQVWKASGGTIIETRKYDRHRDENKGGMYIITDDKDLGEELGKIITMEGLKG